MQSRKAGRHIVQPRMAVANGKEFFYKQPNGIASRV